MMKNKLFALLLCCLVLALLLCACAPEPPAEGWLESETLSSGGECVSNYETDIVDFYATIKYVDREHSSGYRLQKPTAYGLKLHDDPGGGLKEIEKAKCELIITNADRYDADGMFVEHIDELRFETEFTDMALEEWYLAAPTESDYYYGGKDSKICALVTVYYEGGSASHEICTQRQPNVIPPPLSD